MDSAESEDGVEEGARHASWLELFFDLVFVLAIAELTEGLIEHPDAAGLLTMLALLVPVWWAWIGLAFFATRFPGEDATRRLLTFAAMLASIALAVRVRPAFDGRTVGYALGYAGIRLALVALYARASRPGVRPDAERGAVARGFARLYAVGATLWIVSAAISPPVRYVIWGLALVVDLGTPVVLGRGVLRDAPADTSHLPERIGAFVLIVIGEAVVLVGSGLSDTRWDAASVISAVGGFVVVCCVWWTYFDVGLTPLAKAFERHGGSSNFARDGFSYGHYPLVAGLTVLAAGLELEIGSDAPAAARWFLALGLALALGALSALQALAGRPIGAPVTARAGLVVLLAAMAAVAPPRAVFAAVAGGAFAAVVAWGAARHARAQAQAARAT